ncbi:MAG: bifunctional hydroxymethylpyrimidine kinase/phosphomethylpyrimidine kinase [Crenarchaeota archaeon]|nr:bifunctional hydroxymethylpyrimidine kinase/phosphomethylpyrimidine kinase [Thermoproteota archaeon]
MGKTPIAMTIAGSDSGGGAGIEADLKTFSAMGVHGTVALTAITAQNTVGVFAVQDVDLSIVEKQIDVVFEDIGIDAAKTGMLHRGEVIMLVARKVREYGFPLVVDPVMVAKSGARLLKPEAEESLKKILLPVATVVTPNIFEAEVLSGVRISTLADMRAAARKIAELGPGTVVVKGGHLEEDGEAVDMVYTNGEFRELHGSRINTKNTHGTGCSFSAAIAAGLAKGMSITEALEEAKRFIQAAIEYGLNIGRGHGPVNPSAWIGMDAEKYRVLENLSKAVKLLEDSKISKLLPEVGSNIVMALPKPYAKSVGDVAGIPGRFVKLGDRVLAVRGPEFGASSHVARIVLKVMEYGEEWRAAMNIKYSSEIIEACESLGFTVSFFDRREEPEEVKAREGESLPWGVGKAIEKAGRIPDVIYDLGDVGKEPMVRILGRNAVEVATKVLTVASKLGDWK